jgi:hypothetical protein
MDLLVQLRSFCGLVHGSVGNPAQGGAAGGELLDHLREEEEEDTSLSNDDSETNDPGPSGVSRKRKPEGM